MAELREILAELLQISDDEDLNFRKEIFSDLFEDNRVSEKLRVLVCGDVNNAFYTKTLDKIFTFPKSQAAPFDVQQDYAELHVMPSSTDEAFPMQILNQYDRMIFISRAPQALGKSAITFFSRVRCSASCSYAL